MNLPILPDLPKIWNIETIHNFSSSSLNSYQKSQFNLWYLQRWFLSFYYDKNIFKNPSSTFDTFRDDFYLSIMTKTFSKIPVQPLIPSEMIFLSFYYDKKTFSKLFSRNGSKHTKLLKRGAYTYLSKWMIFVWDSGRC